MAKHRQNTRFFLSVIFGALWFSLGVPQCLFAQSLDIYYFERPPYYVTEQGAPRGFLLELVGKILADAGIEAQYHSIPPKRILKELEDDRFACSVGWFKNHEREKLFKFTRSIYQDKPLVALGMAGNTSRIGRHATLSELFADRGLIIGLIDAFSYGAYVDELLAAQQPRAHKVPNDQSTLPKLIMKGRADYMLVAPEEIEHLLKKSDVSVREFLFFSFADVPMGNVRYMLCSGGVPDALIDRINLSIQKISNEKTNP